ncbi:hypothetical protein ACIHEI_04550 [Kitasatospora sp. NPDC051984]|uniref:hypothetical protein n=1 Tax=Kitasatospora sp. NPDC051984 TaxID=3364059 RepID=UPI0037CC0627
MSPDRELSYPRSLHRLAAMGGIPLMCTEFDDGTTCLVMITPEGAEAVATGRSYLRARFELLNWPAVRVVAPDGRFRYFMVPDAKRSTLDAFLALLAVGPISPRR